MSQQSLEVFNLSATTPNEAFAHARAAAQLEVHGSWSFRRGIDLSAGIEFNARASGSVGDQLRASFEAGVDARLGLALQAAFPIDLFKEAGLVARFQAQAEVAAFAGLTISLSLDEFQRMMHERLPGPTSAFLDIFFEEASFSAGVWGRAAFAAEIIGEAVLVGSLLPTATSGPGFTFSFECAGGVAFGAGIELVTNIGFSDPRRLVDRLAAAITEGVVGEVRNALDDSPATEAALALLRTLLPTAMRSAYQVGVDLVTLPAGEQQAAATNSIIESFLRQGQEELLRAVAQLAADWLAEIVGRDSFLGALLEDETKRQQAIDSLGQLRDRLGELSGIPLSSIDRWILALVACVEPFQAVVGLGVLPPELEDETQHGLAVFWAAGVLAHRVVTFTRDPAQAIADLFGAHPVDTTGASAAAAHIRTAIRKPTGNLTLGDLVAFIADLPDLEAELKRAVPEVGEILDWLQTVLGVDPADLARQLLVTAIAPGPEALTLLENTVTEIFNASLVPAIVRPLKAAHPDDQVLAVFLDELVTPLLVALPAAILPNIHRLDSPEAALRFRETVSAVLFQSIQRLVMSSVDIVLERALSDGERALRAAGQAVALGQATPTMQAMAGGSAQSQLGFPLTRINGQEVLILAADITKLLNDRQRPTLMAATAAVLDLGLGTDQTRDLALRTISGTDDPPERPALDTVLKEVQDAAWEVIEFAVPRGVELIGRRVQELAAELAVAIQLGAQAIVQQIEAGIAYIGQQLEALRKQLEELLKQVSDLVAAVAAEIKKIADDALKQTSVILARVRQSGLNVVNEYIGYLPDWLQWLGDWFRDLYNAAFDLVQEVVEGVLGFLSSVAGWVRDSLNSRLNTASYDEAAVRADVRKKIVESPSAEIVFDLAIDVPFVGVISLGKFSIDAGGILGTAADVVLGSTVFGSALKQAASQSLKRQSTAAQAEVTRQAIDGKLATQDQAKAEFRQLVPGLLLRITVNPQAGSTVNAPAAVSIRIDGANRTFIEPTLGAPRRVTITLNGHDYAYRPEDWTVDGSGISFNSQIAAIPVPAASAREVSSSTEEITRPVGVVASMSPDGTLTLRTPGGGGQWDTSMASAGARMNGDGVHVEADAIVVAPARVFRGPDELARTLVEMQSRPEPMSFGTEFPLTAVARVKVKTYTPPSSVSAVTVPAAPAGSPAGAETTAVAAATTALPGQPGLNTLHVAISDGKQQKASASSTFFLSPSVPAKAPYAAVVSGKTVYADSSKTQILDPAAIGIRESVWVSVRAINTGTATWRRAGSNPVRLGTENPRDRRSVLSSAGWISPDRPCGLTEESVAPGGAGTFEFLVTPPPAGGTFNESFGLVAEGLTSFDNFSVTFSATFLPHTPPANSSPPTVSGRLLVGKELVASTGTWSGTQPIRFGYQWQGSSAGEPFSNIAGATKANYLVGTADAGSKVAVVVTASNRAGSRSVTSAAVTIPVPDTPPANTSPPSISGQPLVGQKLISAPGAWSGTEPMEFAYQWQRSLSEDAYISIAGATGVSYIPAEADAGLNIRVVVKATNGAGSATASSVGIAVRLPADPPANLSPPAISGPPAVGQTLTAAPGSWSGTEPISFGYRWQRTLAGGATTDIPSATAPSYVLVAADAGATVTVVVTAVNEAGSASAPSAGLAVPGPASPPSNEVPPSISGSPVVGQTLTAAPGSWSGTEPISFAFRWRRASAGSPPADIAGATAGSYPLVGEDAGTTVGVVVTASNEAGSASATAPGVAVPVLASLPANEVPPSISGPPAVGQTLTAAPGSWSGTEPISFGYRWQRTLAGGAPGVIPGAMEASYPLVAEDAGTTVSVVVTATNDVGSASATAPGVAVPAPAQTAPPTNTGPPSISGQPSVGQTLTAIAGSWTGTAPIRFEHQWRKATTGGVPTDIPRATGATYTLVAADTGSTVMVMVTATNQVGSATASSPGVAVAAAAGTGKPTNTALPTISGQPLVGEMLTAAPGSWTGSAPITFSYQWQRMSLKGKAVNIRGAVEANYRLARGDAGSTVAVAVTAANRAGTGTASSAAVTVQSGAPANTTPPTISGAPLVGQTLTAAPGSWTGSAPITFSYQWQRMSPKGKAVNIRGAAEVSYRLDKDDAGSSVLVTVTAKNKTGSEKASSTPVRVTADTGKPINTVLPTISGAPLVGSVLAADPGTWLGTPPPTYTYQWRRCDGDGESCVDIAGATDASYVPQSGGIEVMAQALTTADEPQGDFGSTLRVRVTATNPAGTESATSDPTPVIGARGRPSPIQDTTNQ